MQRYFPLFVVEFVVYEGGFDRHFSRLRWRNRWYLSSNIIYYHNEIAMVVKKKSGGMPSELNMVSKYFRSQSRHTESVLQRPDTV